MMRSDRRVSELEALYERDFAAFVRVSRGIVGDGTLVAVGAAAGLYVLNADGTDVRRVTTADPYSGRPAWQPTLGQAVRTLPRG